MIPASIEDFNNIRFLTVDDFTSPVPVTVGEEESVQAVVGLMESNSIRHVPVVRGDEVVGIISDRDIKASMRFAGYEALVAKEIMTNDPYIVDSSTHIDQVAFEMSRQKIGSALVINEDGGIGIFTATDALNALVEIIRGTSGQ